MKRGESSTSVTTELGKKVIQCLDEMLTHRVSSTRSTFSKPLIRLVGHSLWARDPALLTKDNTTCSWEIRASTECKATGNRFMVGVTRMSVWVGLQRRNIFCLPSLCNHINACKCLYNSSHYAAEHTNISVPKNSVCVCVCVYVK